MLTGLLQQSVISGLTTGCVYAIVGICVVLIFKSARFPDFAQGTWIVLGGMLGASFFARGLPLWLSMILAVLSTALLGAACWIVFLHGPMKRGMSGLHLCMITVGLAMGIAAVLQMTIGTRSMSLPPFAKIEPIHLSKVTISPQAPWLWLTLLLTMFGLVFLFNHTYWGKQIRACHQRHLGAILIGLNPSRSDFYLCVRRRLSGYLGRSNGWNDTGCISQRYISNIDGLHSLFSWGSDKSARSGDSWPGDRSYRIADSSIYFYELYGYRPVINHHRVFAFSANRIVW